MVSHNPNDAREGYCGRCRAWTRDAALDGKAFAFGEPWNEDAALDLVFVAAPVGWPCVLCTTPIEAGDQGQFSTIVTFGAVHIQCLALGLIGHDHGVCHCNGYDTSSKAAADELWRRLGHR
jgi:hypothetical protein